MYVRVYDRPIIIDLTFERQVAALVALLVPADVALALKWMAAAITAIVAAMTKKSRDVYVVCPSLGSPAAQCATCLVDLYCSFIWPAGRYLLAPVC
jgi:hypothetical protein